jgi:hypothetical protein
VRCYRTLDAAQAAWSLNDLEADLLPGLAVRLLEAGRDSHSIRVLAGFDRPTYWDVIDPFEKVMREDGRTRLPEPQAARLLAYDAIHRFEAGEIPLREALHRLNGLHMSQIENDSLDALATIPGFLDDLEDGWSGRSKEEIELDIRGTLSWIRQVWDADPSLRQH